MAPTYDFANILLSGPCNLRCPYCIGRQVEARFTQDILDLFPPRNLGTFVALLRQHGVRQVVLTGTNTDPQLYRHEARLIAWLREQLPGAQLSLHTNGQCAVNKMAVFNLYDRVSLSFPSFDPDTYERMAGSRRVPDLARILREARVPVKISCVIHSPNAGALDDFLARCRALGIQRVVLRQLYGDTRTWDILPGRPPASTYRSNPVYDLDGMEVTYWRFEDTTSTSLNLFSDGSISTEYLLAKPALLSAYPETNHEGHKGHEGKDESGLSSFVSFVPFVVFGQILRRLPCHPNAWSHCLNRLPSTPRCAARSWPSCRPRSASSRRPSFLLSGAY